MSRPTDNLYVLKELLTSNPFFASCVASSAAMLIWRPVAKGAVVTWLQMLFPPLWSVGSTFMLGISALLLPITLDRYLGSVPYRARHYPAEVRLASCSKHKSTIMFDCGKFGVYNWECRPTRAFAPSLNWSPNKNS